MDVAKHRDPVTGDPLTNGEYISLLVQGVIRRWIFLGALTAVTLIVWFINDPVGLTWWNLSASFLAIVIESVVGMFVFGQTKRDALIIRQIARNTQMHEQMQMQMFDLLKKIDALLQREEQQLSAIETELEEAS